MTTTLTRRRALVLAAPTVSTLVIGCQPAAPPAPAAPAATDKLFISADTVQGPKNVPQAQAAMRACVLTSRIPRNGEVVFRARVFDPRTGDIMTDKDLSSVQVQLAAGQDLNLHFGGHPPKGQPQEFYWTVAYPVAKDHPTGTLRYKILAHATDGRSGVFEPPIVEAAIPSITDEVLPDLAA